MRFYPIVWGARIQNCSSQPSIVYWLSSSIFPCLFVGFFVRRPALVTVSFLNFLLFLLRFCLFRKNSLLLQTFSSFSLSVFFSSAKKYISSLNIFPLFPLCLSSPPQRIYFPFLKIGFGHNFWLEDRKKIRQFPKKGIFFRISSLYESEADSSQGWRQTYSTGKLASSSFPYHTRSIWRKKKLDSCVKQNLTGWLPTIPENVIIEVWITFDVLPILGRSSYA